MKKIGAIIYSFLILASCGQNENKNLKSQASKNNSEIIRKIHLDFHTKPDVNGVGSNFDPDMFAEMLQSAHVNYIATPGKCQFGNTYFNTRLGQTHPGLVKSDLFPATVAACVKRGIKVQAYFTLGLDDVTAARHPDWRQKYKNGNYAAWGAKHICFASPYVDEVVIPEVLEMIDRCPEISGFWFDICLYCDGAFYSPSFEHAAREKLGILASNDNARWRLARQLIRESCLKIDNAVKSRLPEAENYFNSLVTPGEPENILLQPIQEVENPILFGGPDKMTVDARWLRWHGRPVIGLVSRFQGPWMDPGNLRTQDQLLFDVSRTVALGCQVSMGDHRQPDGMLDAEVYKRIAPLYSTLEQCEKWLIGAKPCREAVLVGDIESGSPQILSRFTSVTEQAARILEELGIQFDIATVEEEWPETKLIILPGESSTSPKLPARLEKYIAEGGSVLAMGKTVNGMEKLFGVKIRHAITESSQLNIKTDGAGQISTSNTQLGGHFLHLRKELDSVATFYQLIQKEANDITELPGVTVLADRVLPISTTPPCAGKQILGPFIVQNGKVIYSAAPLFNEVAATGADEPERIIGLLCERLLDHRLVKHNGGSSVTANLHFNQYGYSLHLLNWAIGRWDRRNPTAVFPRLGAIDVEVFSGKPIHSIKLQPSDQLISFTQENGICRFTVPSLHVWQLISLETK